MYIYVCLQVYVYVNIYMCICIRAVRVKFWLEILDLQACIDESLGHRYLSLAGSHGSVADRQSQSQKPWP